MTDKVDLSELKARVRQAVGESFDVLDDVPADEVFASLTERERDALAYGALRAWAWEIKREHQLRVERAAQGERMRAESQRRAEQLAAQLRASKASYAEIEKDPDRYPSTLSRRKEREMFRGWLGDRFEDWHDRASALVDTPGTRLNRYGADLFAEDWYPGGPRAHQHMMMSVAVAELVREMAEEIRLEVTEELLASTFALGDGVRVTWRTATVDQHHQRIVLLQQNATANAQAAARHLAAIRMCQEAGASCLGALQAGAA